LDDRGCLNGVIYVLRTGITWAELPRQLGYGSGVTCWRRLRDWQQTGVWDRLLALLLAELRAAGLLDLARCDRQFPCAGQKGDTAVGPSPVDRGRPGSKHHLLVDAGGLPLAVRVTGANRHDVTQLLPLVDQVPPIRGRPGRPLRRPCQLVGDRAYDSDPEPVNLGETGHAGNC
jgi:transposase